MPDPTYIVINADGDEEVVDLGNDGEFEQRLFQMGQAPKDPDQPIEIVYTGDDGNMQHDVVRAGDIANIRDLAQQGNRSLRILTGNAEIQPLAGQIFARDDKESTRRVLANNYRGTALFNAAANTLSFGLSGAAQEAIRPGTRRTSGMVAENVPGFTRIGMTAGVFGPLLLPGGQGGLLRQAFRAAGPAGLARTIAPSAERFFAGQISRTLGLSERGSRVAGVIGREATEGIVASAAMNHAVSQITNTELTAERVFSDAGMGMVLGLGLQGVVTGGRALVNRMSMTPGTRLVSGSRIDAAEQSIVRQTPTELGETLLRSPDAPQLRMMDTNTRASLIRSPESMVRAADDIATNIKAATDEFSSYARTVRDYDSLAPQFAKALGDVPREVVAAASDNAAQRIRVAVTQALDNNAFKGSSDLLGKTLGVVEGRAAAIRGGTPAQMHRQLVGLSDDLGVAAAKESDASGFLHEQRTLLNAALGDENAFGRAGTIFSKRNAVLDTEVGILKASSDIGGTESGPVVTSGRLRDAFKDFEEPRGDITVDRLREITKNLEDHSADASNLGIPTSLGKATEGLTQSIERHALDINRRAQFNRAVKAEAEATSLPQILARNVSPALGAVVGNMAGGGLGGLAGGAAVTALKFAANPAKTWEKILEWEKVLRRVGGRMEKASLALKKSIESGERSLGRLGRPSVTATATPLVAALRNPATRQEAFVELADEIMELSANPELLINRLGATTESLDLLDESVSQYSQEVAVGSLFYLAGVLPPVVMDPLFPNQVMVPPSATDMDEFTDKVAALEDPVSVYEDIASGIPNASGMEAVRSVLPSMHNEMRMQAMEVLTEVASAGGTVSYQSRIQLGQAFGLDIDPTLSGQFVQAMQSTAAQTEQQAQASGITGPRPASRPLGLASATLTQSQSVEEGL